MAQDWTCEECGFSLFIPVQAPGLKISRLGLYSDGRFPGRCILVLNTHAEHIELLDGQTRSDFWSDAVHVGRAVKASTGSPRVNYAILGNATPHLHIHIIPRQPGAEELPTRSPWNDPRDSFELSPQAMALLKQRLEQVLRES